jgi:cytochrome c biogenesis protein CcmG, thiol:disulfide interchange protein DsbE
VLLAPRKEANEVMIEKHRPRLVLLALIAQLGCATAGGPGPSTEPAAVGSPLPALEVTDFEGRAFGGRALAGQVVLLDIWASWCAPCKEELPLLDAMAARLRAKGITIVAVSIDESRDDALGFLRSRRNSWSLSFAHDPEGRLAERLKPPKMPTSYIVDRDGIIRQVNSGFERGDVAKIEARLTQLAAQP